MSQQTVELDQPEVILISEDLIKLKHSASELEKEVTDFRNNHYGQEGCSYDYTYLKRYSEEFFGVLKSLTGGQDSVVLSTKPEGWWKRSAEDCLPESILARVMSRLNELYFLERVPTAEVCGAVGQEIQSLIFLISMLQQVQTARLLSSISSS